MTDFPQGTSAHTISLLLGHPDPSTLASLEFGAELRGAANRADLFKMLQYGPEQGTPGLIQFLTEKLNHDEHLTLEPDNMMIVAGSTHAVDMIARLYAKPGGVVLVEAPSYADSIHIFRDHGLDLYGIPMDDEGLRVDALAGLLQTLKANGKAPTLLYSIPDFHNPTGITLAHTRRLEVLRLAAQYGFAIVEDDVYRELGFERTPPPSFYALADEQQQVFRIGSFSKTLAPGLRVGWLISSKAAIQHCINAGTTQMGGGANPFAAGLIAEYCRAGHWDQHLDRLRALYQARRDAVLGALAEHMPPTVRWTQPDGGFFIWLTLPDTIFARDVKQMALQEGVLVASGEGFFIQPAEGSHHLRLAFSFAPIPAMQVAMERLAQVIRRLA
jgi:2-aminoadipate transaminase